MIDFYYRDRKLSITQSRNINSFESCYFTDTQDWSACKNVIKKFLFEDTFKNYLIIHPQPDFIFFKIKRHFTTIQAGGGLVFNEKNELLMIFRRGKWDLPKGKIDPGETIDMTALREVSEETGLTKLELKNLVYTSYHFYTEKSKQFLKETFWYAMKGSSTENTLPQAEEEIDQVLWCDENQCKENLKNSYRNIEELIDLYKRSLVEAQDEKSQLDC